MAVSAGEWERLELDPDMELNPLVQGMPPISTVTLYQGDMAAAARHLSEQLVRVATVNPWLCGRLKKGGHKKLGFYVPSVPDTTALLVQAKDVGIRVGMEYPSMIKRVLKGERLICQPASKAKEKDEPLFRVALTPAGEGHFAMVVSLNHTVGDGHTFYRVYGMLGVGAKMEGKKMSAVRRMGFPKAAREAVGLKNYDWLMGAGNIIGCLRATLYGAPTGPDIRYINQEWVQREKESHDPGATGVPFISTNDVVTSEVFKSTGADFNLMAINFRGRVHGAVDEDAGNYENAVFYLPSQSDAPHKIRQSISHPPDFTAGEPTPPGCFTSSKGRRGLVTNWATFYEDVPLPGAEQLLHVPLIEHDALAVGYAVAIIFCPRKGELAIWSFVRDFARTKKMLESPMVGGDVLAAVAKGN